MASASPPWAAASSVTLRNPGPATSTLLTADSRTRRSAMILATSRAGLPAGLASCIATDVA
jgi:hypothetical protein